MDAAAQVAELLQGLQAAARVVGQEAERRREEVAEGLAVRASHAAAHLVQVAEAEVVRGVDDDGVRVRDVDAVLHDGGGEQHVVVVVDEVRDDFLQLRGRHLPVAHGHAGVRDVPCQQLPQVLEGADAVRHDEHLPVAAHLEVHGLGDDLVAERVYLRLYRAAVGRRRLDDGEVARAHHGELQGARDGRGGHRERVHARLHHAQLLLHAHAELLLLVDDEQAEVLEAHLLADELVRADDDVHRAVRQAREELLHLLRRACAGEVLYLHGEVAQAFAERLVVLQGQDGGGHEHGHLLVVHGGLQGGAHGNFRLAEAHVAAYEAVHRARTFHVALHLLRHAQLVRRVLVLEARLQLLLQERVGAEGKALLADAVGIEAYEVGRDVLQLRLRALLHAFPRPRAEAAEARRLPVLALVLRELVEGVDADEHHVVALVRQLDHLLLRAVGTRHAHQSREAPDAVVYVDDEVARLELHQLLQRERHLRVARALALEVVFVEAVEYLVVREECRHEVGVRKARVEGRGCPLKSPLPPPPSGGGFRCRAELLPRRGEGGGGRYFPQPLQLLLAVRTYIYYIPARVKVVEG